MRRVPDVRVCRLTLSTIALTAAAACTRSLADFDDIYSHGNEHLVMCSASIDDKVHLSHQEIVDAIERARDDGSTLHLYTHVPGETVQVATIETVLAGASARGVAFATYSELSGGAAPGSVALSFDDDRVDSWSTLRPLFASYHARVTFFVAGFLEMSDTEHAELRQLAGDGHDIEFHSTHHLEAPAYAADHGLDGYVADEILPGLDAMHAAGYAITAFAYPYGERNQSLDDALAPYFDHLRATRSRCPR